jgi:hypothetical protein
MYLQLYHRGEPSRSLGQPTGVSQADDLREGGTEKVSNVSFSVISLFSSIFFIDPSG